jgi:hypothetical protein
MMSLSKEQRVSLKCWEKIGKTVTVTYQLMQQWAEYVCESGLVVPLFLKKVESNERPGWPQPVDTTTG